MSGPGVAGPGKGPVVARERAWLSFAVRQDGPLVGSDPCVDGPNICGGTPEAEERALPGS